MTARIETIRSGESGFALIETMIAIVIFSFAVLGLVGVQASMIGQSIDAKFRADAAYLANQLIGQMWVDRANLASYAHHPTGATVCHPTGTASAYANVTAWLNELEQALPGATAASQQITVTSAGGTSTVRVTVCWQRPQDNQVRNFVTTAQINN